MAKTKISEFSTTAGNNTDINSINIAEGCAPSGINDAIRELMRQLKEFQTGGAGDSVNSGGDFSVATNKFTVASASGNTAVAGTLAVTGTTTLTGALVANGNATLGDGSGDTVTVKGTPTLEVNPTLSGGTANGVLYLNGSKVATSGSALTFDGSIFQASGVIRGSLGANQGFEAGWSSGASYAFAQGYDRTAGTFQPLALTGTNLQFLVGSSPTEAMRLTSTGLGIGTSSPAAKLDVFPAPSSSTFGGIRVKSATATDAIGLYQTGSAYTYGSVGSLQSWIYSNYGDLNITSDATGIIKFQRASGTETARFDSSGNLGIGTSSPGAKLDVQGSGGSFNSSIYVHDSAADMGISVYSANNSGTPSFRLLNGLNSARIWLSGDANGNLNFGGPWNTTTALMTLTGSGKLGIGVTNPSVGLVVAFGTDGIIGNYYSSSGANSRISFSNTSLLNNNVSIGSSSDALVMYTGGSERARIDSSGNLLVGSSSSLGYRSQIFSSTNGYTEALVQTAGYSSGSLSGTVFSGYYDATNITDMASIRGGKENTTSGNYGGMLAFYTRSNGGSDTERARIDSSGNLLVGTTSTNETSGTGARLGADGYVRSTRAGSTSAASTLDVYSTGASAFRFYVDMAGTVFATNTTISAISDIRFKENVRDLNVGLAEVMALKPRLYDWKEGKGANIKNARGFIAQEFEQVFPDLIDEWKDHAPEGEEPYKSVRQDLIPVLVKAIQEQQALIQQLTARVAQLESN